LNPLFTRARDKKEPEGTAHAKQTGSMLIPCLKALGGKQSRTMAAKE